MRTAHGQDPDGLTVNYGKVSVGTEWVVYLRRGIEDFTLGWCATEHEAREVAKGVGSELGLSVVKEVTR